MFDLEGGFRVFQAYSEGPFEPESARFAAQGLFRFIPALLIVFVFIASLLYLALDGSRSEAPTASAGVKEEPPASGSATPRRT
jgi:hypothetical protein